MFKVERNLPTTSFIVPPFAILCNTIALLLILVHTTTITTTTTTAYAIENNQPDINATNLYKTHIWFLEIM